MSSIPSDGPKVMDAWTMPISGAEKRRVCYFFDSEIGNFHYATQHPMKPHRIKMTHALVMNYHLYRKMEIFRAKPATRKEMAQFHTDEYVDFLSRITPENMDNYAREQAKFNVGDDCPVFDGLFDYCSISAGGSMEGAARLSRDKCDIAVNWAGGLHHAKKAEASGFCYVNDIVLGILELLRYHQRVLYIDIDVHHGDGVEEAFYTTDRVMTCSFHKYGEFFPGTGEFRDVGHGKGKYYSVNFPLRDGITDESYKSVFEPVIDKIMEWYKPSAVVLQCGADSLAGDRLGPLNLSMRGHANCVAYVKKFGLPLLLLGGGGYTIRNVSRTWAYETGLAAGLELTADIPMNEYYEYFGPTYQIDVPSTNQEDMNTREYLEKIKAQIFDNLRHTGHAPSVQQQPIPKLARDDMEEDEDLDDPDERKPQRQQDMVISRDEEFEDSDDEEGPLSQPKTGIELNGNASKSPEVVITPSSTTETKTSAPPAEPVPSPSTFTQVGAPTTFQDEPAPASSAQSESPAIATKPTNAPTPSSSTVSAIETTPTIITPQIDEKAEGSTTSASLPATTITIPAEDPPAPASTPVHPPSDKQDVEMEDVTMGV